MQTRPTSGRQRIGVELWQLRFGRKGCDYDDEVSNLDYLAADSLERAAEVLALLGRL